jgi:hypothetical protein
MRNLLTGFFILLLLLAITCIPACGGGGGGDGGGGDLVADYDLEGEEYLADPDTPIDRFCKMFSIPWAVANSGNGWESFPWPYFGFTGDKNVAAGLDVKVLVQGAPLIAEGVTNGDGRVMFSHVPTGILIMVITGTDGHQYYAPVQISDGVTSHFQAVVYTNPDTGIVELTGKTIHDSDSDGEPDDSFSFAIYGRPVDLNTQGMIILHDGTTTSVDANGDGDYTDSGDKTFTEPDDDGISSDQGDGDEDNDGILDTVDEDIDGDGIPNTEDPDIDGDGLLNESDPFPGGITPLDDFDPPYKDADVPYPGVNTLSQIDSYVVEVIFPRAYDDKHEPVTYNIYYSTTTPIDFGSAEIQRFKPMNPDTPDGLYHDNIFVNPNQVYYFVVRAEDAAQPPNEDQNTAEMNIWVDPNYPN